MFRFLAYWSYRAEGAAYLIWEVVSTIIFLAACLWPRDRDDE